MDYCKESLTLGKTSECSGTESLPLIRNNRLFATSKINLRRSKNHWDFLIALFLPFDHAVSVSFDQVGLCANLGIGVNFFWPKMIRKVDFSL
jgi:hypothetical protein